jgi:hypothetical protein
MTYLADYDNKEMVEEIISIVEVFVEELLEEFDTDPEKIGALGANVSMSLTLLCRAKGEQAVLAWLNGIVRTWSDNNGMLH